MRSEVSITFKGAAPVRIDLNEVQPMPHDVARWWWGVWAAERTCAANRPQRSIFRRFLAQYLDIGRRNHQKLVGAGPDFRLHAFCRPDS